jgi:hypothetical protein
MRLKAFPLLRRRSQLPMLRTKTKWGKEYHYSPRGNLLVRVSKQLGISIEDAYHQIITEREYLLSHPQEITIRGH